IAAITVPVPGCTALECSSVTMLFRVEPGCGSTGNLSRASQVRLEIYNTADVRLEAFGALLANSAPRMLITSFGLARDNWKGLPVNANLVDHHCAGRDCAQRL